MLGAAQLAASREGLNSMNEYTESNVMWNKQLTNLLRISITGFLDGRYVAVAPCSTSAYYMEPGMCPALLASEHIRGLCNLGSFPPPRGGLDTRSHFWTIRGKLPRLIGSTVHIFGARGSVVGWGIMLQAGRSPVRVPDEVDFFILPNPSSCTMALGSTQPLTKMSTRNLPGGKKRPAPRADNLAAICEPNVRKYGSLNLSQP
jgi:hypothetical protein